MVDMGHGGARSHTLLRTRGAYDRRRTEEEVDVAVLVEVRGGRREHQLVVVGGHVEVALRRNHSCVIALSPLGSPRTASLEALCLIHDERCSAFRRAPGGYRILRVAQLSSASQRAARGLAPA